MDEKQEKALALLASGGSPEEVAQKCGVQITVLAEWRQDDAFIDALRERCMAMKGENMQLLPGIVHKAMITVAKLMDSKEEKIQFRASQVVLGSFAKWIAEDQTADIALWSEERIQSEIDRIQGALTRKQKEKEPLNVEYKQLDDDAN